MYALKIELKLNKKERSKLAGCAGFARFVYNYGLSLLTQSWEFKDIKANDSKRLAAIEKVFTNHVKTNPNYYWIKEYPSAIYSLALRNLASALDRWRKGLSEFPKFKSRKSRDSFTVLKKSGIYPAKGEKMLLYTNRQVLYPGKLITIPSLGEFKLKRPIPFLCSSQTFTMSKTADKWYVSFTIDAEKIPPVYHEEESVGIDLGVKFFATLSDGSAITAPLTLKQAKTKLKKEQWRNRNKQIGNRRLGIQTSSNAKKYFNKLATKHAYIANVRKDFLQKTTTEISRKSYCIRIEDLNISGMIANSKLSEAVSSLGLYEFRRMLTYKSSFYGTKVELVDRWFPSSKTANRPGGSLQVASGGFACSCCGHIQPMPLSERVFRCFGCNSVQDRDVNAAINLKNAPDSKVRLAESELNACGEEGAVSPQRSRKQTSKRSS